MNASPLKAHGLNSLSSIAHAFFPRTWGKIDIDSLAASDREAVSTQAAMAKALGVEARALTFCRQVHLTDVIPVEKPWAAAQAPEADGMVTDKPGIALGILTADCVPVLFACANAPIIGAAHAGWRGARNGVLEKTVAAMEKLGAKRSSICAALGPCIWQASYEVGPDFPACFLDETTENTAYFTPSAIKEQHYHFDLAGYVAEKLRKLSLGTVEPSPANTFADRARFLSYRRTTLEGSVEKERLVSAIALK